MFLNLEFDDVTKRFTVNENLLTLQKLKEYVKIVKCWKADSFYLEILGPSGYPILLSSDDEFHNFLDNNKGTMFLNVKVNLVYSNNYSYNTKNKQTLEINRCNENSEQAIIFGVSDSIKKLNSDKISKGDSNLNNIRNGGLKSNIGVKKIEPCLYNPLQVKNETESINHQKQNYTNSLNSSLNVFSENNVSGAKNIQTAKTAKPRKARGRPLKATMRIIPKNHIVTIDHQNNQEEKPVAIQKRYKNENSISWKVRDELSRH